MVKYAPAGDSVRLSMKIKICPVKQLYRILAEGSFERSGAVISSAAEIDPTKLRGIPYVFRQYEDLDCECPGRSFSQTDAAAFASFLKHLGTGMDTLYCCCDAGESRSPAVAAAMMRYLGMDDMPLWQDPHYHPNMLVFEMLTNALECPVSHEEKDFRFYTNRKAFQDAIRKIEQFEEE